MTDRMDREYGALGEPLDEALGEPLDEPLDEPLGELLASAVASLPREREPGRLVEERAVRSLRGAGVLSGGRRVPRSWVAAAAAAAIALFASGLTVGQWLGTRQTANALVAQQQSTLEEMSALVERTGGAYISALTRLAETQQGPATAESRHAQEAALQILHLAANEVVRLAPDDPVASRILQGFDHAALQQAPPSTGGERRRQIMWF